MNWDNGWHDGRGGGGWLLMALVMVLFWAGLAWVIVNLVRHGGSSHQAHPAPPAPAVNPGSVERRAPEDILHERLARGEIDIDEYHQRIDALRAKRP